MNILIIGDYPEETGGVCNYTRPLAIELSLNNHVWYLYNTTKQPHMYSLIPNRVKAIKGTNWIELSNGNARYINYPDFRYDTNSWFDKKFKTIIENIKPDIIHINEIFGFSSNIINIAKKHNIRVIITVHEYWWLCPHRVMVDFNKKICQGPDNIGKCTFCVYHRYKNYRENRLLEYLKRKNIFFYKKYIFLKSKIIKKKAVLDNLKFSTINYNEFRNKEIPLHLEHRLGKNIYNLNKADKIIAVSYDVKNKLIQFGVHSEKILVNHIGSTIANWDIKHTKKIDKNKIIFGFIGGITYYKGIHQLIEAWISLEDELKQQSYLKLYGKYEKTYVNSIKNLIIKNAPLKSHIIFYGKYNHEEIPYISNNIDIMVLPSLCADTAPQTIFESFACGLPIIAPEIGGFPDFVKHLKNGLLYEKGSASSLADKLRYILKNPHKIEELKKHIPHLKTIKENTAELISIYEK